MTHGARPRGGTACRALPLVLVAALVLLGAAPTAAAKAAAARPGAAPVPPAAVRKALAAWSAAVESGDPERIAALLPEGGVLIVRPRLHPTLPPELRLDRAELERRLKSGEANPLGLDRHLLLPTKRHLKRAADGRWEARDRRCPEVTWVFAKDPTGTWVLAEVLRDFLAC